MTELYLRSILAGIMFGLWPLFMNRSGLSGNLSSAAFSSAVLLGVLPFVIKDVGGFSNVDFKWTMLAAAGAFGAMGLLSFNGMLAKASLKNVSSLIAVMLVVQIATAAIYKAVMAGQVSSRQIAGFLTAILTAILLSRD